MEKQFNTLLESISLSDIKEIKQELIVNWDKNDNEEYIYKSCEKITTILEQK